MINGYWLWTGHDINHETLSLLSTHSTKNTSIRLENKGAKIGQRLKYNSSQYNCVI